MHKDIQTPDSRQHANKTYAKLILPFISENWRKIRNAALSAKLCFAYTLDNDSWQCQAAHSIQPMQWACILHLHVGGYPCHCYLDNLAPLALSPLNYHDLKAMPKELLKVVFQSSLTQILQGITHSIGYECELIDFQLFDDDKKNPSNTFLPPEEGLAFTLTATQRQHSTRGFFVAEEPHPISDFLYTKAQDVLIQEEFSISPIKDIRLPLAVTKNLSSLTIQDINNLEAGDCLLFPSQCHTLDAYLQISEMSSLKALWDMQKHTLTLENTMQEDILPQNIYEDEDNAEGYVDQPPLVKPQQCTVPLQCQLGTVSLSLAEVSNLCPGMVLGPLDSLEAPVTIRLGNTTVGRGALIEIEGRLGVQLTEVYLAK